MFKKVMPYMGEYMSYTKKAVVCVVIAVILSVLPYFFLYQLISPLILGEKLTLETVLIYVILTAVCLAGNAVLYVQGLSYSHHSAYNTLKNIRISLQKKLEAQPLGNIRELGSGRIKKVFADDIDMIELLLAHAIPEGIGNLFIPIAVMTAMLFVDWKLAPLYCGASSRNACNGNDVQGGICPLFTAITA
ncbi:MAG: ABC transporter ATP-binding protein [Oscillospiraceae bacterium]|nr:ABC transporter ATP-binding protein [Oscillospiraceae bacterium]